MGGHDLPCDSEGSCMVCKVKPEEAETLFCATCATPWHAACLSSPPRDLSSTIGWICPDCSLTFDAAAAVVPPAPSSGVDGGGNSGELLTAIRAIQADSSLSEEEKAKKRQELMTKTAREDAALDDDKKSDVGQDNTEGVFQCAFCLQLPERPVTTPCGHNFCLKCFQKWVGMGKRTCAKCRGSIPSRMIEQPRINSALVAAIRLSRMPKVIVSGAPKVYNYSIHNKDRPDKAFTTERAKRNGKSNACSGKIFVTVPPDHFGPIPAENDPEMNQGVLVGECWEDRMECRQWGAHLPHVAGIAGQSDYGAQSVALSGGYQDDEDHGEWFLYTGSGGRDLSGNKRTNKDQAFDQKFDKMNEALRVSCKKGYPVRVVRSHKEKRSSYAPESGVRYDGVYRIEKCWRKIGIQGFKVCRYLFVRCDNEAAPWTSDNHGDRPRPLPVIKELKGATDIAERKESPSWDYEEGKGWLWKKPPPPSRKQTAVWNGEDSGKTRKVRGNNKNKFPSEILCGRCRKVMTLPVTTPCGHSFCKACLQSAFPPVRERKSVSGRSLRAPKVVRQCPTCMQCIDEFFQDPKVNLDLQTMIETIQKRAKEREADASGGEVDEGCEAEELDPNVDSGESTGSEIAEIPQSVSVDTGERKRKMADSRDSSNAGNKRQKKNDIAVDERVVENQGSPSSPLLVQSDGDAE